MIKPGITAAFAPSGITAEVKSIEMHHEVRDEAGAGNNVGFNVKNVAAKDISRGDVASDANDHPASAVSSFEAQVIVMNHPGKISNGYTPVIDIHTAHVACKFANIKEKIDRKTGEVLEKNPEFIETGDACLVDLEPTRPLCVEPFSDFPPLGRFAIRDMKQTVAVGVVKKINRAEPVVKKKR
jgi:elongation factor 1-alpha